MHTAQWQAVVATTHRKKNGTDTDVLLGCDSELLLSSLKLKHTKQNAMCKLHSVFCTTFIDTKIGMAACHIVREPDFQVRK